MLHSKPEVWMRGPIEGISPLLQPIAHALLQADEEVTVLFSSAFPDSKLWVKPAGLASVGFHLQHMKGVLDRMFTYAVSKSVDENQLTYLTSEGIPSDKITTQDLVNQFQTQVKNALEQLKKTDESALLESRGVGRKNIPSNVIGLLFHSAEHIQRHLGQLLVTTTIVTKLSDEDIL